MVEDISGQPSIDSVSWLLIAGKVIEKYKMCILNRKRVMKDIKRLKRSLVCFEIERVLGTRPHPAILLV